MSLLFLCSVQHLTEKFIPDGLVKVVKMLEHRPGDWARCVQLARVKFEKYFNHKVRMTFYICGRLYDRTRDT